jgi:hypothetical protein
VITLQWRPSVLGQRPIAAAPGLHETSHRCRSGLA